MAKMTTTAKRLLHATILALVALLMTGFKGCAIIEQEPNNTPCTGFTGCEPDPDQTYFDYTGGFAGRGRVTYGLYDSDVADWWVFRSDGTATQTITSTVVGDCVDYAMENCEVESGGTCTHWGPISGSLGQHCGSDAQPKVIGSFATTQSQLVALGVLVEGFGTHADYRLELDRPVMGGFGATCTSGADCESGICVDAQLFKDGCSSGTHCTILCATTDECVAAGGDECHPFGLANLCMSAAWFAAAGCG
jgi:hypothetical protein